MVKTRRKTVINLAPPLVLINRALIIERHQWNKIFAR